MTRLTLASTSAIRKQLLRNAGVEIEVVASGLDEEPLKHALQMEQASPREIADVLAEAKSKKVSLRRDGWVIGVDSTLELDGRLFDKPIDLADARRHLLALRGRVHAIHTAAVISQAGSPIWRALATAKLSMRDFTDDFLERYLDEEAEAALSSVGCYQLEGCGAQLFEEIDGDYFCVLGLPLLPILGFLRLHGKMPS